MIRCVRSKDRLSPEVLNNLWSVLENPCNSTCSSIDTYSDTYPLQPPAMTFSCTPSAFLSQPLLFFGTDLTSSLHQHSFSQECWDCSGDIFSSIRHITTTKVHPAETPPLEPLPALHCSSLVWGACSLTVPLGKLQLIYLISLAMYSLTAVVVIIASLASLAVSQGINPNSVSLSTRREYSSLTYMIISLTDGRAMVQ